MTPTNPSPPSGCSGVGARHIAEPVAAGVWAALGLAALICLGFMFGPLYLFVADGVAHQPIDDPGDAGGTGTALMLVAFLGFLYITVAACHIHMSGRHLWFGTSRTGSALLWWAVDLVAYVVPGLGWLGWALWFA